ncbi:hypothetical protein [uncultured Sulfitobacter sp.]|uniref:hypothetical protein n=1 Tax=uncultured Sulfitobacter sp. TaxID=191468 RepID=UPI0025982D70|nr:hypothetical protein [uncultured Sulfitobacter sp.]
MTDLKNWPTPLWLGDTKPADREKAELDYHLRLAAIYATKEGTLTALSVAMGYKEDYLAVTKSRGSLPPKTAIAIEDFCGRERFPRELFRPDLFTLPE